MSKKKVIPITKDFDKKIIGKMVIMKDEIPLGANYSFQIGGQVVEKKDGKIIEFEILEVSLIRDKKETKQNELERT